MDLVGEARAIEDKGWQAVALAAVAVTRTGPLDLDEVNSLIGEVAHGDPRIRVWREVIGRCVAAGRYDQLARAVDLRRRYHRRRRRYLVVIAAKLGVSAAEDSSGANAATVGDREAARAALLRLLPRCARYPAAAYAACTALAMAFPAEAAVIARVIAQHAAVITAVTGEP